MTNNTCACGKSTRSPYKTACSDCEQKAAKQARVSLAQKHASERAEKRFEVFKAGTVLDAKRAAIRTMAGMAGPFCTNIAAAIQHVADDQRTLDYLTFDFGLPSDPYRTRMVPVSIRTKFLREENVYGHTFSVSKFEVSVGTSSFSETDLVFVASYLQVMQEAVKFAMLLQNAIGAEYDQTAYKTEQESA